jgi:hypothetical protein
VTTKKLISTKDLALLIRGKDIIYRLSFYCVFNRLKGEHRGGRYTRGSRKSRIARSTLPD